MDREQRLSETFVALADTLVDDFDVVDLMVLLTERCVELLHASAAGLLLADAGGHLRVIATTSEAIETVELFQVQNEEGPCQDCFTTGKPVSAPDLEAERSRWPRFSPVAIHGGFRCAHALPMRLRHRVLGALNLFRTEPAEMSAQDLATGQALADVATIALLQSRTVDDARLVADQLENALQSRVMIEQAKGIIAQSLGCDMVEAFSRLRGYARSRRARLSMVAAQVVDGTLKPATLVAQGVRRRSAGGVGMSLDA
jgi:GAF domain-containing protein